MFSFLNQILEGGEINWSESAFDKWKIYSTLLLYRSHFVVCFLNCYFRSSREYTPFCLTMTSDLMKCKIVFYLKDDRVEIRKGSNNDFEC